MADPSAAPILFDRALLLQRQGRARRQGAATVLLDRVCEDMEEGLSAVERELAEVADIWPPGAGVSQRPRFKSFRHIAQAVDEVVALPPESLDLAISAL